MKIFGREPALILALFAATVQVGSTFIWHLTSEQQAWVNATAVALAGFITAVLVHDGVQAAVLCLVQAVLSLAVGFGAHIAPGEQAVIMAAIAAGIALWVRDRVTAPVPASEISIMRPGG
jgi:hypothetical protein